MSSVDPIPSPEAPSVQIVRFAELDAEHGKANGVTAPSQPAAVNGSLQIPLRHVQVTVTVRVGAAELSLGEILDAKAGQVIRLDASVDQPVDVLVGAQVVARGILVAVEDRFGVRITELPVALDLSSGAPR